MGGEGLKVVDKENMCWYHECVLGANGTLTFLPRRCALGSKISYYFVQSYSNPCTINLNSGE